MLLDGSPGGSVPGSPTMGDSEGAGSAGVCLAKTGCIVHLQSATMEAVFSTEPKYVVMCGIIIKS